MKGSVLVTGGARRIGRAICEALSARGWNVLAHSRDPGNPLALDFAKCDTGADRLFAIAVEAAPDLCAIVNNASEFSPAVEMPPEDARRIMCVNATTPARLTELLAEHLAQSGGEGSVVNMLDAGVVGLTTVARGVSPYVESKMRLTAATLADARRFAPALRVNGVAPGPVLPPEDMAKKVKGGDVLLGRRPSPQDVAAAVAFMLETPSVTGQVLAVDSGQSLLL